MQICVGMHVASLSESPRALITGLGGFTGRYLAREMTAAGYRVYGTTHNSEDVGPGRFPVDLCNRKEVEHLVDTVRPDIVAHLAAISFVAHGDVEAMYRVNVVGTRNLLESLASLDVRPKSVLLASSANVYGNAYAEVINESLPPSPVNDYAISKLTMEYIARLWMDQLPITIVRPFNYTGVGQAQNFLLPKIVSHFQRHEKIIELGNIDIERDFSDVRMIAKAYRILLKASPANEIFNVCSGSVISLKRILEIMAEIAGYEIEVSTNAALIRSNEIKRLRGDASKLNALTGLTPCFTLQDTLRWMYESSGYSVTKQHPHQPPTSKRSLP